MAYYCLSVLLHMYLLEGLPNQVLQIQWGGGRGRGWGGEREGGRGWGEREGEELANVLHNFVSPACDARTTGDKQSEL